jgi:O-ureido-D-serine cyclo-ligase
METSRIALVSAHVARPLDDDLAPLEAALHAAGAEVSIEDWDDPAVEWESFDLALLRSAWDYSRRLPEFLAWAQEISRLTTLVNPLPVIQWNTDKHYLAELHHAGVATVPSHFIEPADDAAAGLQRFFALHPALADFVVKPAVSAGSRDTQRYAREDIEIARAHAQKLLDKGRSVLLQPYLHRIDDLGEKCLIFYAGEFSHAVHKGPLLKRGEPPISALLAKEVVQASDAETDELRVAAAALAAQPFGTLSYARVDLIRHSNGAPCVLELEMCEPSMFFNLSPGAAERFAAVVMASIQRGL